MINPKKPPVAFLREIHSRAMATKLPAPPVTRCPGSPLTASYRPFTTKL